MESFFIKRTYDLVLRCPFRSLPNITVLHVAIFQTMLGLLFIGSFIFPMIDLETLKPNQQFPNWLKTVSYYFNIPIKFGLVHSFIYVLELFWDTDSGKRHIGQRITTLWMQLYENPRFGQHFHMQLETSLQVADMFKREHKKHVKYNYFFKAAFVMIIALMMVTNYITSSGYHTFHEQLIGAALASAKLIFFDYYKPIERINGKVGDVYTGFRTLVVGFVIALGLILISIILLGSLSIHQDFIWHPTSLSSFMWIGCAIYGLISR